jgi:hypothetical protein
MGTGQVSLRRLIFVIACAVLLPIGSCSDDDVGPPLEPREVYKSLDTDSPRDNVLFNLQTAYNDRNINRYDELLDDDFVFYFSDEDVLNGFPHYWSRAAEINANKNMFDPNYSNPNQQPVQDLDLILTYPGGDDQWTPFDAPDQVKYPGETWYTKTVTYNLTLTLPGDFQYISHNKQADFTLRAATKDSKQYWKIVVWRDDTGTGFAGLDRAEWSASASQPATWGQIKAVFGD